MKFAVPTVEWLAEKWGMMQTSLRASCDLYNDNFEPGEAMCRICPVGDNCTAHRSGPSCRETILQAALVGSGELTPLDWLCEEWRKMQEGLREEPGEPGIDMCFYCPVVKTICIGDEGGHNCRQAILWATGYYIDS